VRLPTTLGWDSHNYVTMAVDARISPRLGNMHGVPLIYFRTSEPLNIDTFAQVPSMSAPTNFFAPTTVLSGSFRGARLAYATAPAATATTSSIPTRGQSQLVAPHNTPFSTAGVVQRLPVAPSWGLMAGIISSGFGATPPTQHQPRPLLCEEQDLVNCRPLAAQR